MFDDDNNTVHIVYRIQCVHLCYKIEHKQNKYT